jgi:hypothetical protein
MYMTKRDYLVSKMSEAKRNALAKHSAKFTEPQPNWRDLLLKKYPKTKDLLAALGKDHSYVNLGELANPEHNKLFDAWHERQRVHNKPFYTAVEKAYNDAEAKIYLDGASSAILDEFLKVLASLR